MRRTRNRIAIGLTTLLGSLAIGLTVNALAASGEDRSMTAVAAQATARFHNLDAAKDAGWKVLVVDKAGLTCIDNQPVGGMGVHWANGSILFDADLDPTQPEALVYAPNAAGQPKLAALEYIVFDQAWKDAGHTDPTDLPELFGHQFALTPDPNRFGLPAFWSLHVWIWQPNAAGTFEPWNPGVHC